MEPRFVLNRATWRFQPLDQSPQVCKLVLMNFEYIGFRETAGGVTLDDVRLDDAYSIFGKTMTATGAATSWGKGDLVINGVEIFDTNVLTNTAAKKVEAINNFSAETGVTASLSHRLVFDLSAKYSTNTASDVVVINGTSAAVGASIGALVSNINDDTATTGVTAEAQGKNLVLMQVVFHKL